MCERMKCFDSIVYFHYVMITCLKAEANLDITYEENLFRKEFQCFARVKYSLKSSAAQNIFNRF